MNDFFAISLLYPLGRVWSYIWTDLNLHHLKMLCAKFGWNWPCGSGGENKNVRSLPKWTTDKFRSEKITWALNGSSDLKIQMELIKIQNICIWNINNTVIKTHLPKNNNSSAVDVDTVIKTWLHVRNFTGNYKNIMNIQIHYLQFINRYIKTPFTFFCKDEHNIGIQNGSRKVYPSPLLICFQC